MKSGGGQDKGVLRTEQAAVNATVERCRSLQADEGLSWETTERKERRGCCLYLALTRDVSGPEQHGFTPAHHNQRKTIWNYKERQLMGRPLDQL